MGENHGIPVILSRVMDSPGAQVTNAFGQVLDESLGWHHEMDEGPQGLSG